MNKYVILPSVKYFKISNFNLYKNNEFEWTFDRNFNLFLGINGLGKTTSLNLIAYALVGLIDKDEKDENNKKIRKSEIEEFTEIMDYGISDRNFFKRYDEQKNSQVYIEFELDNNKISLTRDMLKHRITSLCVNNESLYEELDRSYDNIFEKYSGITIQNFTRILYTLLIRYEEAPSLLFRPRTQHTALRTLFFDDSFHEKFLNAERIYRSLNGDFRRLSDQLKNKRDEILENEKVCKEKDAALIELGEKDEGANNEILKLEQRKKDYILEVNKIDKDIILNEKSLEELSKNHSNLISKKDTICYEKEILEEEIITLEKSVYSYIYSANSIYNLAINSAKYNDCIFCGSKINEDNVKKLLESIDQSSCPFCHSKVGLYNINSKVNLSELDNKLEKKRSISVYLKEISKEIDDIAIQINTIKQKNEKLYNQRSEIYKLQILCDKELDNYNNQIKGSNFFILQNELKNSKYILDRHVEEFEKESLKIFGYKIDYGGFNSAKEARKGIGGIDKKLEDAKIHFDCLLNQSEKGVKDFEREIIQRFNKYNVLNREFTLEVKESDTIEHNISFKYNIFIPVEIKTNSYGVRDKASKLSKSQQIILDYAFRMALIEYYCEITNNKDVFIMFETSEGVFDFSNVVKFSETLLKYSQQNKILLISNLSNVDYLKSILNIDLPDSKKNILNFIEFSGKENIDKDFFDKKIDEIKKLF